jgi:hypothetical protein
MDKIGNDSSLNQNLKRGRGRPRKNQIVSDLEKNRKLQSNTQNITEQKIIFKETKKEDDEIILHLPISLKDIIVSDTPVHEHQKDEPSSNEYNTNIFTINDMNSDTESEETNADNLIVGELKQKIKMLEKKVCSLQSELDEYKSQASENIYNGINGRKVTKMNIEFISTQDGTTVVTEKTDIACWWCTYNFDTMPCFLPDKYYDNKFYVFGCFCSFECAAAYNLNSGDSYMWNRYSLLKRLYSAIHKHTQEHEEISIAPPREAFKKFGGVLSHDEFRKNCKQIKKEYRFVMPPLAPITPFIEEGMHTDSTKINITLADLNKKGAIKRSKPLPSTKNNLFETFGLKEKK